MTMEGRQQMDDTTRRESPASTGDPVGEGRDPAASIMRLTETLLYAALAFGILSILVLAAGADPAFEVLRALALVAAVLAAVAGIVAFGARHGAPEDGPGS